MGKISLKFKKPDKKTVKLVLILLVVVISAAALAGSTYYSFKQDQAKKLKKAMKKAKPKVEKIVPIDRSTYKSISLYEDIGRTNPFGPQYSMEVPKSGLTSDGDLLTPPPLGGVEESEAAAVMSTTVSGIMYDDINPSAIINIEGMEYFVKKNDVVNKYHILAISPKQVTVQYGKNVYKAGVGEIFADIESNSNIVNLNKKFGGNNFDNISINVRKR